MTNRSLPVRLLAAILCLALPSTSMAQWHAMEPGAAEGRIAPAPVPAMTSMELRDAMRAGEPMALDMWTRLPASAQGTSATAAEAAAAGGASAQAAGSAAARAEGPRQASRTKRAALRIGHLLRSAEGLFSPEANGSQDEQPASAPETRPEASAAPEVQPAAAAPASEEQLPTAKLVSQLRELAQSDPQAALARAEKLLASDKRLEVRLAAVRTAAGVPGPAAAALLAKNLGSDSFMYVRRESAKKLGERAEGTQEGRAEVLEALRQTLRETARPRSGPGMHDSLFLMAAWALERFGESAETFRADREKTASPAAPRWRVSDPAPSSDVSTPPPAPEQSGGFLSFFRSKKILAAIFGGLLFLEILALGRSGQAPNPNMAAPSQIEQSITAPHARSGAPLRGTVEALKQADAAKLSAKPAETAKPAEAAKAPTADQSLADIAKQLKAQNDRAEKQELEKKMAQQNSMPGWLGTVLYLVVMVAIMIGVSRFLQGQQMKGAAKMGSFDVQPKRQNVRFDDVAGADDARKDVEEIVDFLKNPAKYKRLGAEIPKGALLVGPPGTGKTLMAKAVAGETGASFFTVSGSDFVEMFVGVGAQRVRALLDAAKKNAPSIIFIDEIDAIGKKRGGGMQTNDEREQTLNQLLVAMDGFDNSEGIVFLAATNREDVLDPALLRPGRFDRRIHVGNPDVLGREAILQIHAQKVPLSHDADLELVAKRTPGLSGAFLKNVVNEGALQGSRRNGTSVNASDLDKGIAKNTIGAERPNMFVPASTKKRIAEHEIGHVLVSWYMTGKVPYKVTSIPHGDGALGYAESAQEDEFLHTEPMLKNRLAILMGGRAAEKRIYGNYSSGADNDLEVATRIARAMVQRFGMGQGTGFAQTSPDQNSFVSNVSEQTKREVDLEIRRLLAEADAAANRILDEHWTTHNVLSKKLVDDETMFGEEIEKVAGPSQQKP